MKIIDVTINRIDRLTAQSVKLTFNTAHLPEFRYKAGQYVTLCLTIQGEEYRRAYSICSSPSDENVAVAVKEVEGGKVSTHVNRHLMPGAAVRLMVPQGHFVFTPDATKKRHIVLFGAGSGVTPLLSIAKAVLEGEPNSTVTLFYGNSSKDSIMFYSELDEMAADPRLKVYHILSDGSQQEPLFSGRINFGKTSELLYNFTNDGLNKEYYICGPAPMMQGVKEALLDNGIASDCIHMEYFEAPAAPKEPVQASNESMPA
ncbi:MAG: hypothetical protein RL226_1394, partial [Bacteroidota bacterium]